MAAAIWSWLLSNDDWTLRLGPLTHGAAWAAIEAFLGLPGPPSV